MNIEHRTSNIERWMGKDEETDIWSGRKAARRKDEHRTSNAQHRML